MKKIIIENRTKFELLEIADLIQVFLDDKEEPFLREWENNDINISAIRTKTSIRFKIKHVVQHKNTK